MRVICFDLDDTLYKEIEFLKSAFMEIAAYAVKYCVDSSEPPEVLKNKAYDLMLRTYQDGGNAFRNLNTYLGLELPIDTLIQKYREHVPQISLVGDVRYTLNRLKNDGVLMGVVSDGHELTQWNKVLSLGLTEWMDVSCIIINSTQECFKPSPCGYERFVAAVSALTSMKDLSFEYVGDNLKKDFIYPKSLGWKTYCLRDDGRNIHYQDFGSASADALPDRMLESIIELI